MIEHINKKLYDEYLSYGLNECNVTETIMNESCQH
jgi:hypothetical protein